MNICYLNFNLANPRDQVTLRGLKENGIVVKEISDSTPGWWKYLTLVKTYRSHCRGCDLIMIGYAGGVLVTLMRLLTRKPIVYNALNTLLDGVVVSRRGGRMFSLSVAWLYLIDFLAFHLATRVFLECHSQKELVGRWFRVRESKLIVQVVGVDDNQFYFDSQIAKLDQFTVVFRGAFLPEAGADIVVRAAKELESSGIRFRILGRGLWQAQIESLIHELRPSNLELITAILPISTLRQKMLECHLSLGQLANHPRVQTTIPHKAFESLALKLPYLTGDNRGIREILVPNQTCFVVSPGDYRALARQIVDLENQPSELARVGENAYQLYCERFTPRLLTKQVMGELERVVKGSRKR